MHLFFTNKLQSIINHFQILLHSTHESQLHIYISVGRAPICQPNTLSRGQMTKQCTYKCIPRTKAKLAKFTACAHIRPHQVKIRHSMYAMLLYPHMRRAVLEEEQRKHCVCIPQSAHKHDTLWYVWLHVECILYMVLRCLFLKLWLLQVHCKVATEQTSIGVNAARKACGRPYTKLGLSKGLHIIVSSKPKINAEAIFIEKQDHFGVTKITRDLNDC